MKEKGFTLVEIMVALAVLSIGFLGVASMRISAVKIHTLAGHMTRATNLAQNKIEELMELEYTRDVTDSRLTDDSAMDTAGEPYTDDNANGYWDVGEPYTDANQNGAWNGAHVDQNPPTGYTITWSVTDNMPTPLSKNIRVYVKGLNSGRTIALSCIKSRD